MSQNPDSTQPDAVEGTGPERDLDMVIGTALAVAQDQYAQNGAIMPFAVVLENAESTARRVAEDDDAPQDGQPPLRLVLVAPDEEQEEVDGQETVEALYETLAEQIADLDAAAVISDVTLLDASSDALHVAAEHRSGDCVGVLQLYSEGDSGIEWGELEADVVEPRIFSL